MSLDPSDVNAYRAQLAALPPGQADETTLHTLVRLKRELAARVGAEKVSHTAMQKAQVLRRYLTAGPIALPEGAPPEVRSIAQTLEGRLWSLDLLASFDERLQALERRPLESHDRLAALRVEIQRMQKEKAVLHEYVRMLDAFTGSSSRKGGDA